MIVLALIVLTVGLLLIRRARARAERAGIVSERPVFHVAPPDRRLGTRKGQRL